MGMVHQAFKLFNSLTVWENIVYGAEPRRGAFIDRRAARRECRRTRRAPWSRASIPTRRSAKLSVGVRQRVEILKALYRDARILILDEPTAVLTPQERDGLFAVMRHLAAEGRTILFVTHKLHEVMAITDRVTVLRDGRVVARMRTSETTPREIVRAMTGRNVNLQDRQRPRDARRAAAGGERPHRRFAGRQAARRQGRASRCAPAKSSASPASPAMARANSSRRWSACESPTAARCCISGR